MLVELKNPKLPFEIDFLRKHLKQPQSSPKLTSYPKKSKCLEPILDTNCHLKTKITKRHKETLYILIYSVLFI